MKKIIALILICALPAMAAERVRSLMTKTNGTLADSDTNFFIVNYAKAIEAGLGGSSSNGGTPILQSATIKVTPIGVSNRLDVVGNLTNNTSGNAATATLATTATTADIATTISATESNRIYLTGWLASSNTAWILSKNATNDLPEIAMGNNMSGIESGGIIPINLNTNTPLRMLGGVMLDTNGNVTATSFIGNVSTATLAANSTLWGSQPATPAGLAAIVGGYAITNTQAVLILGGPSAVFNGSFFGLTTGLTNASGAALGTAAFTAATAYDAAGAALADGVLNTNFTRAAVADVATNGTIYRPGTNILWVTTDGNDATAAKGLRPWRNLYSAITNATKGDRFRFSKGVFGITNEWRQIEGVSFEGEGNETVVGYLGPVNDQTTDMWWVFSSNNFSALNLVFTNVVFHDGNAVATVNFASTNHLYKNVRFENAGQRDIFRAAGFGWWYSSIEGCFLTCSDDHVLQWYYSSFKDSQFSLVNVVSVARSGLSGLIRGDMITVDNCTLMTSDLLVTNPFIQCANVDGLDYAAGDTSYPGYNVLKNSITVINTRIIHTNANAASTFLVNGISVGRSSWDSDFGGFTNFTASINKNGTNKSISFGDGSGLTGLPAASLTGTMADARLSSNVPLKDGNNTFTGTNTFAGGMTASNMSVATILVTVSNIGTTITPTLVLTNLDAATVGAQKVSPAIMMQGNGWKTTPSTSTNMGMGFDVLPVQGAAVPTATLRVVKQVGGAAPAATGVSIDDSGTLAVPALTVAGNIFVSGGYFGSSGSQPVTIGAITTPRTLFQTLTNAFYANNNYLTNGFSTSTNYVAANFSPTPGHMKFVGSNNWLFVVTSFSTNPVVQTQP